MAGNDDETAYAIWRKTNTIDWARIGAVPPNTGTYVDGNLSANTPYTYRVRAINNLGPSPWTNEVTATIALPAPLAPSNLAASAVSSTQVNLTWTDNSSNETAFAIWRQTGAGSWARVGVVAPNTTTFSDLGLAPNTPYTYEVRAINNGGASPWSNQVTASTPATVSFSQDILRIFNNNGAKTCAQAGCHSGGNPTGHMNLEAANAYANIVNVPSTENPALKRVKPGDSANSYLFQKVNSGAMPLAGGPLTAADINTIKTWIDQGASNN
jgi:hypothetical protein